MSGSEKNLNYYAQLKHPNWQRKRLLMLEAAGWSCTQCESKENTLHVHHKRYVKGRMAWEYEDRELSVLCDQCHTDEHALKDILEQMLSDSVGWQPLRTIVALVGGYLHAQYDIPNALAKKAEAAWPGKFRMGVVAHAIGMAKEAELSKFIRETCGAGGMSEIDPVTASLLMSFDESSKDHGDGE